ncbi:hypothetical protein EC988_004495 [Linderina pennispora]|nr:hypothetical protein EC988_004495 [Linderina pennispora]
MPWCIFCLAVHALVGEDIDRILANACHRHQKPKSRLRSLVDLARQTMAVSSGSSVATQGLSGLKALSQGSSSSNSSNNKPVSLKSLSSLGKSGSGSGGRSISLKSLSSLGGPPKPNPAASLAGSSVVGQALAALKPQSPQQQQGQQAPTAAAKAGLAKASLAGLLDKSSTPTLRNFAGRTLPSLRPITSPRTAADESLGAAAAGRTRASLAIDSLPIAPPTMYAAPSSLADFLLQDIRPTGQRTMAEDVVDQMQREIRAIMERNVKGNVVDSETMETNRRDVTFLTALVGKKEKAKKQPFAFDTPSPDDKVFAAQSKATNAPVAAGTEKKGNV